MARVSVSINGRVFDLACDEGQEGQLRDLARFFDGHVQELNRKFTNIGEPRVFIMAGLMIADQLAESLAEIEDIKREVVGLRQAGQQMRGQTLRIEESAVGDIEGLAERIEDLTRSLQV
jgi:cell division protein ZapA